MESLELLRMARRSAEDCDLCVRADRADREGLSVGGHDPGKPIAAGGSSKDWTDRLIALMDPNADRSERAKLAAYSRRVMDGAWELIGLVSEDMGEDGYARVLAEYYLEPAHDWQDVAGRVGKSERTVQVWRDRACAWLDANYEISVTPEDGTVTVRRAWRVAPRAAQSRGM